MASRASTGLCSFKRQSSESKATCILTKQHAAPIFGTVVSPRPHLVSANSSQNSTATTLAARGSPSRALYALGGGELMVVRGGAERGPTRAGGEEGHFKAARIL